MLTKRGANLYDPESIKETIVNQTWSNGRKNNAVDAYSSYLKMVGGKWQAPLYTTIRKLPFIPKESEIDILIAVVRTLYSLFIFGAGGGIRTLCEWRNHPHPPIFDCAVQRFSAKC